jgi:hypothetical protein
MKKTPRDLTLTKHHRPARFHGQRHWGKPLKQPRLLTPTERYLLAQRVLPGVIEPLSVRSNLRLEARRYRAAMKKQILFTARTWRFKK